MKSASSATVFFSVLNMGLGHATRSLPIIREFRKRGWSVVVGSSGRSLLFLKNELPDLSFVELPDYPFRYSRKGVSLIKLLRQLPEFFRVVRQEKRITDELVRRKDIRLVISDHRYGCYSGEVPSYFISHQLQFIAPAFLRPFEFIGAGFNRRFHRKYRGVIVPDKLSGNEGAISGRLSRIPTSDSNYHFPGTLSSLSRQQAEEDIDVLISISGPEPQRTVLEQTVRQQLHQLPGNCVIVLGLPGPEKTETPRPGITIHNHLNRDRMQNLMSRSRLVVSRSGYSTLMELAELGKKALLIPTPGQTEQIYLAHRLHQKGWFYSVAQNDLQLQNHIPEAQNFPGFPFRFSTSQTVEAIFELLEKEKVGS